MFGDRWILFLISMKGYIMLFIALWMVSIPFWGCGTTGTRSGFPAIVHYDGAMDLYAPAVRFAPRLYLHQDEPFEIIDIIPVFHPTQSVIAYHIFFEEDVLFAGRGKEIDHEVLWVEYDPITLKASDVATLWHGTVLRTDICIMNAKASQQRPIVFIQWGQHGVLPLGWETLRTARPSSDLFVHYTLVKTLNRIPGAQKLDSPVVFQGSYREYLQFAREIDAAYYLKNQKIIVAEYSAEQLLSRVGQAFKVKKEWPFWSPAD